MRRIRNPNRWSCLPASFAMVLDCSLAELVVQIGHDGSAITWPELDEPNCRRGFHIQELVDCAWTRGYSVTAFEAAPCLASAPKGSMTPTGKIVEIYQNAYVIMTERIERGIGVLSGLLANGNRHAVAVECGTLWCPSGDCRAFLDDFAISTFYAVSKRGAVIKST